MAFTFWARFAAVLLLSTLVSGCVRFGGRAEPRAPQRPAHVIPDMAPVAYEPMHVSSRFGGRGGRLHRGIDFAVREGTPVQATADGLVRFSGQQRGYGNIVIIDHALGYATAYAHLRKRLVDQGALIVRGQTIGLVGQTGNATGPHLHYEVRRNDRPEDPTLYLP